MPGWIARLSRMFSSDVQIDPNAGGNTSQGAGSFFAGDAEDESTWMQYQQFLETDSERKRLYDLYDEMDVTDVVAGILDLYSENATKVDPDREQTIWVESKNKKLEERCNDLLLDLNVEEEITAMARELAKYGDLFERTIYQKGSGVFATHAVHPKLMNRKEDKVHKLLGFHQDGKKFRRKTSSLSYPWDYVHFRLRGKHREGVYGTSILANMIRPWKQLIIAEDHSLVYQISRHPDRNLFLIDVGTQSEVEAQKTIRRFKQAVKYTTNKDPKTGKFDHRFNPLTPMDDVYLGTRPNANTRVEKLAGSANASDIANLNFYINKLFSAARTPKTAFGYEGRMEYNTKAQLTNQDIRFARNVERLQRALKHGFRTLIQIHLILSMQDPERDAVYDWRREGNDFTVKMAPVSWLEELERLELIQLRWQVVDSMISTGRDHPAFNSQKWVAFILKNFMHLSDSRLRSVMAPSKVARDREDMMLGMPRMVGQQTKATMQAQMDAEQSAGGGEQQAGEESISDVSDDEARAILEVVASSPKLQELIVKGRDIFEPESSGFKPLALNEEELSQEDLSDDFDDDDTE